MNFIDASIDTARDICTSQPLNILIGTYVVALLIYNEWFIYPENMVSDALSGNECLKYTMILSQVYMENIIPRLENKIEL